MKKHELNVEPAWLGWSKPSLASFVELGLVKPSLAGCANPAAGFRRTLLARPAGLGSHDQQGRICATKTNKTRFVQPEPASENSKEIGFQQARNIGSDEMIETDRIGSIGADFMFVL
ncbi:hypothetical protein SLEP1_g45886 [Rubroshorea leprosula]|uniref:Uncharacterized protein n=1 Tax=Rubroshorea leprosula TaxID=152421 RepID=A0AAV5LKK2_9ROSI|nr:hypothetical protein SLEP1_g45886 [Rubroshorea leprosula]